MKIFNILKLISNNAVSLSDRITALENKNIFPVGSIYMSVNSTSPATLFGGTWVRIQNTFLLAAGSTYAAGTTGGEATHTLTTDEMPSHTHSLKRPALVYYSGGDGSIPGGSSWIGSDQVGASKVTDTGGGAAHNNMPPYLAVYVWKRTA